MSQKFFTHATPTLFNAGTPRSQLSSCYLLAMKDDSISEFTKHYPIAQKSVNGLAE